jgi:hypothetical protein
LLKIKKYHPYAECLLRIKCESLPKKFGADLNDSYELIAMSMRLKINIIGF